MIAGALVPSTMLGYLSYAWGINPPLAIMAIVAFAALILVGATLIMSWIEAVRNKRGGPLEIIFDQENPGRKFWSIESPRNENGEIQPGVFWEYRVEVKNNSAKTIRNVSVTIEYIGNILPKRPVEAIFDNIMKSTRDVKPRMSALAPILRWPIPIRLPGMLAGPSAYEYGPIKITVSGDDTKPTTRIFSFNYENEPMIFDYDPSTIPPNTLSIVSRSL